MVKKYYEKQLCRWTFLVIIPIVLIPVLSSSAFTIPYALLELMLIFIFINFLYLTIEIDGKYLVFGFGIFKKKIKLKDIGSCRKATINPRDCLGVGVKLGIDKTFAYNTRFSGNGIKIKLKDKKKNYVISTNNAEKIYNLFKK